MFFSSPYLTRWGIILRYETVAECGTKVRSSYFNAAGNQEGLKQCCGTKRFQQEEPLCLSLLLPRSSVPSTERP